MNSPLNAYMNHSRWLIKCPRCGADLPAYGEHEKGVVCPVCWPGMKAVLFQPVENGLLRRIHDMQTIEETREKARQQGEFYVPEFPPERQKIEEILRCRRNIADMSWDPDETLDDLRADNLAHGDPLPEHPKGRK